MAEMVCSAVVQEAVSRTVSSVLSDRDEESKRRSIERLEMAHVELEFALERSPKLPITDVSLLRQRRMVKRAYEECGDVLQTCKMRLMEEDQEASQRVVTRISSLPKRIFHAMRSFVSSSASSEKDELTNSDVARFEWFADKARRFARDVETGCSLSHYRFCRPFIRKRLEMKYLWYERVRGSHINRLLIVPVSSEERGVEAWIFFCSENRMIGKKKIHLCSMVRLSESTDIIGITNKCLQSLAPVFKPFAEDAIRELAELTTRPVSLVDVRIHLSNMYTPICLLQDPLCCRGIKVDGHGICANNTVASKFPPQVIYMSFCCSVSAFQLQGLTSKAEINVVKDWPSLQLSACFQPHRLCQDLQENLASEKIG